jgi:hypothetical protein
MSRRLLGSLCLNRVSRFGIVTLQLAGLVLACSATMAVAGGPPMLAVEMPAKAVDASAQGATLVVRASQCGESIDAEVMGRAEGVVAGKRRTIPLRMRLMPQKGAWAVAKQWPDEGRWILVFTVESHGRATAMVDLPAAGAKDAAPKVELIHRIVAAKEIDSRLSG